MKGKTMSTVVRKSTAYSDDEVNDRYLELMSVIIKLAQKYFIGYSPDRRAEAVQNVMCWAFMLLKQNAERGRLHDVHPSPLTKFAVGRHYEGRSLGTSTSSTDVMSSYCRSLGRVNAVKNYGICESVSDTFVTEASATDGRYPPDRVVQFRLDFHEGWLANQSERDKQIIHLLASGETPSNTARLVGVSPACINQYQKRYAKSWNAYISDKSDKKDAA
jgi:hypothetical protein